MPDLEFHFVHLGHACGQHDWRLDALDDGSRAGHVSFAEYEGIPHVHMIEVPKERRRQGIATRMVAELQHRYEHVPIDFGGLTEDGNALLTALPWIIHPNEEKIAAEKELRRLEAVLDAYSRRWDTALVGTEQEKASTLDLVADWNDVSDRAEEISRRIFEEPSEFRYVDFQQIIADGTVLNP